MSTLNQLKPAPLDATQLDATVNIVTPENIAFQYRVAGPFRRLPAFVFDLLLRIGVFLGILWIISLLPFLRAATVGVFGAMMIILYFLLDWFYGGLFETYMNGQTPGKAVMRIRVLRVDGRPINGLQAIMRNILRYVDLFPLLSIQTLAFLDPQLAQVPAYVIPTGLLGLIVMTMTHRYQRLGDLVCGTIVVMEERRWLSGVAVLEDERVARLAAYIPADYKVTKSQARTLAAYVDRRRFFSTARRGEVARFLGEPLVALFGLPSDTSHDLLLCALYHRTFIADRQDEVPPGASPFAEPGDTGGTGESRASELIPSR